MAAMEGPALSEAEASAVDSVVSAEEWAAVSEAVVQVEGGRREYKFVN